MIHKSTIQLLRFPFSFFLMPVYWFALSFIKNINVANAVLLFFIIHVLVYPSSNGYNSYMDRDTSSIGGVRQPLQPTKQLFHFTVVMDVMSILTSLIISRTTAVCILIYTLFSRLYSYRNIRLKQYAIIGYFVVTINQGALIFYTVYNAANKNLDSTPPLVGMLCATLLIGGFYPVTQVYQHKDDAADNVKTISMLLGKKRTFIFCSIVYIIAFTCLFFYYNNTHQLYRFGMLAVFFIPVLIYFTLWFLKVNRNIVYADFKHTMRMNMIASTCTNLAFITLLILQQID